MVVPGIDRPEGQPKAERTCLRDLMKEPRHGGSNAGKRSGLPGFPILRVGADDFVHGLANLHKATLETKPLGMACFQQAYPLHPGACCPAVRRVTVLPKWSDPGMSNRCVAPTCAPCPASRWSNGTRQAPAYVGHVGRRMSRPPSTPVAPIKFLNDRSQGTVLRSPTTQTGPASSLTQVSSMRHCRLRCAVFAADSGARRWTANRINGPEGVVIAARMDGNPSNETTSAFLTGTLLNSAMP